MAASVVADASACYASHSMALRLAVPCGPVVPPLKWHMDGTYVAEYVVARSAATVSESMARIAISRANIEAARRRRWCTIRGGSGPDANGAAVHLRARVRLLVNPHEIPRIAAGFCIEPKACDICGRRMPAGSTEYEVGFSTLTVRIDAACFALWQEEMLRTAKRRKR